MPSKPSKNKTRKAAPAKARSAERAPGGRSDANAERVSKTDEVKIESEAEGAFVLRLAGTDIWRPVSRARLARDYDADHPIWRSLRARGVSRPSSTQPEDARERRQFSLRLRPADAARLDELATELGVSRSDAVVRLLDSAGTVLDGSQVPVIIQEKDTKKSA